MGRPAKLTKQELEYLGVTNITKDGRVYQKDWEVKTYVTKHATRFKTMEYHVISLYDPRLYVKQKEEGKQANGLRTICLSRAMWAWFNTECPANMDVDHINSNSLDDRLDNFQLLTRTENLAKRKGHRNQFEKSYRGE